MDTDLFAVDGPVLTGNLAKMHCLLALQRLLETARDLTILDVGCIGPNPLDFWRPLQAHYASRFTLHGIDVAGIAQGQAMARQAGWTNVRLQPGSGYDLATLFPAQSCDVVVATQVLEHMRQKPRFLRAAHTVLKPDGLLLLTLDSDDYAPRKSVAHRGKEVLKRLVVWSTGGERYWDVPVLGDDVAHMALATGFQLLERRDFNVAPLKHLHNHLTEASDQNEFLRRWYALEMFINERAAFREARRRYFLDQYWAFRRG
jgi:2-polyprenyl-3-methyl-5-hydroxy-6-metoxy-1,4-benzoquinol methylase